MTAAVLEQPAPAAPAETTTARSLPDDVLRGLACVLCRNRIPPTWRAARLVEVIEDDHGRPYRLFACQPECAAPPWRGSPLDRLPRWTAAPSMPNPLADDYDTSTATVRRVVDRLRTLVEASAPPDQPSTSAPAFRPRSLGAETPAPGGRAAPAPAARPGGGQDGPLPIRGQAPAPARHSSGRAHPGDRRGGQQ